MNVSRILITFVVLAFHLSCNSVKHLQKSELLLSGSKVKIYTEQKLPNKDYLQYELYTIAKQKPNGKFFFLPRAGIYAAIEDTTKTLKRWLKTTIAEPPVIFDSTLTLESADAMKNYMYKKGFYNAEVDFEAVIDSSKQSVAVEYQIYPKQQYLINDFKISSKDTAIATLLNTNQESSFLQSGEAVTLDLYNSEVRRIKDFLRNNGYFFFNQRYISGFVGDSVGNRINLNLEILPLNDSLNHQLYSVGRINVYPVYDPLDRLILVEKDSLLPVYEPDSNYIHVKDTVIGGLHFFQPNWKNNIKPETIAKVIDIEEGKLYEQDAENRNYFKLSSLNNFSFVSVRPKINPDVDTIIDYDIFLTRNKRYLLEPDFNVNYSNQDQANVSLFEFSASLSLRMRNALKRAEQISNNVSGGIGLSARDLSLNTGDIRVKQILDIPRFVDYFGLWKLLTFYKEESTVLDFLEKGATSRLSLSYDFARRQQFYDYQLFNASFGFETNLRSRHRLVINHAGIDYFAPTVQDSTEFSQILDTNPFLESSFDNQLFTGFLFRNISYYYNLNLKRKGLAYYLNTNLELSGAAVQAFNAIYNGFALEPTTFRIDSIDFARYWSIETDGRLFKTFSPKHSVAFRVNFGIGLPFGLTNELPYVKQFFVGGANSLRAFRARQPGPGSYLSVDVNGDGCSSTNDNLSNIPFYQTGNLKLEFNVEYRFTLFQLFSYNFEGALFLDVGNVWTTNEDDTRVGSQFLLTPRRDQQGTITNDAFYNQLAIGSGFGLRLDFSFFLLRLDMGYPLRTPYRIDCNPWINNLTNQDVNYNLAIGYPF